MGEKNFDFEPSFVEVMSDPARLSVFSTLEDSISIASG